jgi:hypothetical protein
MEVLRGARMRNLRQSDFEAAGSQPDATLMDLNMMVITEGRVRTDAELAHLLH